MRGARGMEGVVAKKANSPYRSKRSPDWLKMKRDPEADFAVCGYTPPKGTRTGLGALHLCVRVDSQWMWAGKVGSGLGTQIVRTLIQGELGGTIDWHTLVGSGTEVTIEVPLRFIENMER